MIPPVRLWYFCIVFRKYPDFIHYRFHWIVAVHGLEQDKLNQNQIAVTVRMTEHNITGNITGKYNGKPKKTLTVRFCLSII